MQKNEYKWTWNNEQIVLSSPYSQYQEANNKSHVLKNNKIQWKIDYNKMNEIFLKKIRNFKHRMTSTEKDQCKMGNKCHIQRMAVFSLLVLTIANFCRTKMCEQNFRTNWTQIENGL